MAVGDDLIARHGAVGLTAGGIVAAHPALDSSDLVAIEEIKQLKARYFRLMDLRDWDAWLEVFTADCVMTLQGEPSVVLEGRHAIVDSARRNLNPRVGMHLGHMPEVSLTGPDSAIGTWSLFACSTPTHDGTAEQTGPAMMSFGRYEDVYQRDSTGTWRIKSVTLSTVVRVLDEPPGNGALLGPTDGVVVYRS